MTSRICWQCESKTHHTLVQGAIFIQKRNGLGDAYGLLRCDKCQAASMAIVSPPLGTRDPSVWANAAFTGETIELALVPQSGTGKDFPAVPVHIAAAANEAHQCRSIAANRAAAMLARSVIEATAEHLRHTSGTLEKKIDGMHAAGIVTEPVKETAHEIRPVGIEMAHGDFALPIDRDDADDVLRFMDEVLNAFYQAPAQLYGSRVQRLARKAARRVAGAGA